MSAFFDKGLQVLVSQPFSQLLGTQLRELKDLANGVVQMGMQDHANQNMFTNRLICGLIRKIRGRKARAALVALPDHTVASIREQLPRCIDQEAAMHALFNPSTSNRKLR